MPYAIQGRIFISLLFNGKEFPLDSNSLGYLHIGSSVRFYLPTVSMRISDVTKFLQVNDFLVDGTIINVKVGRDTQTADYQFRLFSFKEIPGAMSTYLLTGYLDSPIYWTSSLSRIQRGSSSKVLAELAAYSGLKFSGSTTSDSQLWVPQNQRVAEFARKVSEHGWLSPSSCMQLAVTAQKEMRYRDVSSFEALKVTTNFDISKASPEITPITDFRPSNRSGLFNAMTGYQSARVSQSIGRDAEKYDKLTFKKNSVKLSMHKDLSKNTPQNKVAYAPIDVGNVNVNYEKGLYQNRRLANLFSLGLDILTPNQTKSDLLDVVNVSIELPDIKGSQQYSGKYLVCSKVVYVQGANYYEKYELARHGINVKSEPTQL